MIYRNLNKLRAEQRKREKMATELSEAHLRFVNELMNIADKYDANRNSTLVMATQILIDAIATYDFDTYDPETGRFDFGSDEDEIV